MFEAKLGEHRPPTPDAGMAADMQNVVTAGGLALHTVYVFHVSCSCCTVCITHMFPFRFSCVSFVHLVVSIAIAMSIE